MTRAEVRDLQRDLNRFFNRFLDHYQPLNVDGDLGPGTRTRVRDAKFFIGYKREGLNGDPGKRHFRWRLDHPLTVSERRGQYQGSIDRGIARRRREREEECGDHLWGHCRGVTNRMIWIAEQHRPGIRITSRKRSETYGNPGSDHHVSQTNADAVDFARVNDHELADIISRGLGGPSNVADYQNFYIVHDGRRFRVQMIAGTHGTGPHCHGGVRRA